MRPSTLSNLSSGRDPIDEGDVDDLAIEIAGEVEQEDFEQHRALVEHRPPSKAGDAVITTCAHVHAHRIDAVLEAATGIEAQIRGGIAELPPALVAMAHLGADEPGIAEELVCLAHVTGGQRRPDRARANRSSLIVEPRHDIDRKAELCALRREIFGRTPAVEAEMKIEADDDAGDGEPSDQNTRDELGGGQTRQRRIERSTIAPSSPVVASSRSFARSSVRRNNGSFGRKKPRGCGSKVSAAAGRPSAFARVSAAAMTARWPR